MIIIKSLQEIELMRQGGAILAQVLNQVIEQVKPGITTKQLNKVAEDLVFQSGAQPAFKGYQGFPAGLCVSINEEIVHGLPSERKLKQGDIVSLDLGVLYPSEFCASCPLKQNSCGNTPGFFTDAAVTLGVGQISPEAEKLIKITKSALDLSLEKIKPGARLGDISAAIQNYAEANGFNVVRDLVGHGIGCSLHEEPEIPNYGQAGAGPELKEGMVLAIEPMLTIGAPHIEQSPSGFTYKTKDKSLAAHFEYTVAVMKQGYEILTPI